MADNTVLVDFLTALADQVMTHKEHIGFIPTCRLSEIFDIIANHRLSSPLNTASVDIDFVKLRLLAFAENYSEGDPSVKSFCSAFKSGYNTNPASVSRIIIASRDNTATTRGSAVLTALRNTNF